MSNDETGKCTKAKAQLYARKKQIELTKKKLQCLAEALQSVKQLSGEMSPRTDAMRSMAEGMPPRLVFSCNGVNFHIDFSLVADGDSTVGTIVYGTSRTACYPDTVFCGASAEGKEEERPLIQFMVNDMGRIRAKDKLDEEWWLSEDTKEVHKTVSELHFRVLEQIWADALNWTNENILP